MDAGQHPLINLVTNAEVVACEGESGSFRVTIRKHPRFIREDSCVACGNCVDACPFGCIYYNDDLRLAQKCTGCAHLIDRGWKEPRCVDACPTGCLKFGEESEFKELIKQAEVLNPEYKTQPRVYYLNIPRKFVAGTVYDPVRKKIIKGATCTLSGKSGTFTATTNGFGDFWFEDVEVDIYSLNIAADGFAAKKIDNINTEKDVNLGDIPLP